MGVVILLPDDGSTPDKDFRGARDHLEESAGTSRGQEHQRSENPGGCGSWKGRCCKQKPGRRWGRESGPSMELPLGRKTS